MLVEIPYWYCHLWYPLLERQQFMISTQGHYFFSFLESGLFVPFVIHLHIIVARIHGWFISTTLIFCSQHSYVKLPQLSFLHSFPHRQEKNRNPFGFLVSTLSFSLILAFFDLGSPFWRWFGLILGGKTEWRQWYCLILELITVWELLFDYWFLFV